MVKKGERKEERPGGESILAKESITAILQMARENLRRDGAVAPVLFLRLENSENGIVPLVLPATTEEKEAYFEGLGRACRQAGQNIQEALFVSETWFVMAEKEERLSLDVAPSRHPRRKEAITVVGRNAERTRFSFVVQPFYRDPQNHPIFGRPALEQYDISPAQGAQPIGVLDYLFPRRMGLFRDDPRLVE